MQTYLKVRDYKGAIQSEEIPFTLEFSYELGPTEAPGDIFIGHHLEIQFSLDLIKI